MNSFVSWALITVLTIALAIALNLAFAFPIMWLWNGLLPEIFGFKVITWTQALGLSVLIQLFAPKNSSSSNK